MLTLSQKIIQIILSQQGIVNEEFILNNLKIDKNVIEKEINQIQKDLANLNMTLSIEKNIYSIILSEEISEILQKEEDTEIQKPLSESALQTLSIILYTEKTTKAEIDFIRGVDSGRSIKTLLLRGIIEKKKNGQKIYYEATQETLHYMGLESKNYIPDKNLVQEKLIELFNHE
jgi:segregation and condensation protein B